MILLLKICRFSMTHFDVLPRGTSVPSTRLRAMAMRTKLKVDTSGPEKSAAHDTGQFVERRQR